jgi:hypothetical protein
MNESLIIRREAITVLPGLDEGASTWKCLTHDPLGLEFLEGTNPAREALSKVRRHVWAMQELLECSNSPWEIAVHPHDDFEVVLEEAREVDIRRHGRGARALHRLQVAVPNWRRHFQTHRSRKGSRRSYLLEERFSRSNYGLEKRE